MEDQSSTPELTQERTTRLHPRQTNVGPSIIVQNGNHALYVEKQHQNESSEVSSSEYNDQVHDCTQNSNAYQEIAQQFSNEIKPARKIKFQRQWKQQENQEQEKPQSMHEYRKEELVSEKKENNRNRDKRQSQHSQDSRINKKKGKRQQSREGLMRSYIKQESESKKQISKSRQSVQSSSLAAISPPKTSRRILSPQYQSSLQKRKQLRSAQETRRQKEYKSIEEECRKCEKFFQMLGQNESDTKTAEALNQKKDLMQRVRRDLRKYRIQRRERFQQDLWTDDKIFEIRAILEGKIQKEEELMRYIETHGTDSYSDSEVKLFFQETEGLILNFNEMDRRIEQNQSLEVLSVKDLCAKEAQEEQNKVEIHDDDDRELVERLNARNQAKHQEEIQKMKSSMDQLLASHEKENKVRIEKQKQVQAKNNEEIQRLRNSIEQMMASHEKTKEIHTEKQKYVQSKHEEEIQRLKSQIDELTALNASIAELYTGKQKQVEKLKEDVKDQEKKCSDHQREYEVRMQELSRQLSLKEEQSKAFESKLIEKEKQFKEEIDRLMDQVNVRARKHEQAMQELKKDLQVITSKCQDEVRHEQTERVKAEKSHKLREQQLKNTLIQIEKQFQRMVTEHQDRVKELNDEIDRQIEQQETLQGISDHNIDRLNNQIKKQNEEKEKLRQVHEHEKTKLKENNEDQKAKLAQKKERQIKQLSEKLSEKDTQLMRLEEQNRELSNIHQKEKEQAEKKFKKQMQEQQNSHKKTIDIKNKEISDYLKSSNDMRNMNEILKEQLEELRIFRTQSEAMNTYIKVDIVNQTQENVHVIDEFHSRNQNQLQFEGLNRSNDSLQMRQMNQSPRRLESPRFRLLGFLSNSRNNRSGDNNHIEGRQSGHNQQLLRTSRRINDRANELQSPHLNQSNFSFEASEQIIRKMKEKITNYQAQIKQLKDTISRLPGNQVLNSKRKQMQNLNYHIDGLEQQLKRKQTQHQASKKMIQDLVNENQRLSKQLKQIEQKKQLGYRKQRENIQSANRCTSILKQFSSDNRKFLRSERQRRQLDIQHWENMLKSIRFQVISDYLTQIFLHFPDSLTQKLDYLEQREIQFVRKLYSQNSKQGEAIIQQRKYFYNAFKKYISRN